jgi:quercetin dioxygenase-like cupin family protein
MTPTLFPVRIDELRVILFLASADLIRASALRKLQEVLYLKRINEFDIPSKIIEGKIGSVEAYDIIQEEIVAGVRIVKPHCDVPKRIHKHPERQILYVIEGTAEIKNDHETLQVKPGDFVLLDANEEHYVLTKDEELKIFELKYP